MFVKDRYESTELKLLKVLNTRMDLTTEIKQYYFNLEKGFAGEKQFDLHIEPLAKNGWLILNDLLLQYHNSVFQIDSLFISHDTAYLFEVKNFEGDFYISGEKWFSRSGKEIKNPLLQLRRNEDSLRQLLQELGFPFPIESSIVFINPEFLLYQAPLDLPAIFPNQLNQYLKKMNRKPLRLKERHFGFAKRLVSESSNMSPYSKVPNYDYEALKKGIVCSCCKGFLTTLQGKKYVCSSCGYEEGMEAAVMRSVDEFIMLFPDKKITTNIVSDWCKIIRSKKTVRRILGKHLKLIGHGVSSYYIKP